MDILKNKKLPNLLTISNKLKRRIGMVFWLILGILLVLEVFVLKTSVNMVFDSQKAAPVLAQNKGVRINFTDYDKVVKRIRDAESFFPTPEAGADPFTGKRTAKIVLPTSTSESLNASTTPKN